MVDDVKLNWQQACRFMGCSKTHFYRLVNSGELPAQRFGRVKGVLVLKSDCQRYMESWQTRMEEEVDQERQAAG